MNNSYEKKQNPPKTGVGMLVFENLKLLLEKLGNNHLENLSLCIKSYLILVESTELSVVRNNSGKVLFLNWECPENAPGQI